ncbi:L10-interacting MYB domain-containing protein-like [Apium graveolens]|uniref:L10-interacting MYB domain-containing protein-like n=1 Tax=Apium graveolens TaxID=4045 RepID=UPI003D79BB1B
MSRAQSKIRRRDQPSGAAPPVGATPSASFAAKWGDEEHDLFVRLCYGQVVKGNRPNTTLNKEGWKAVYLQFAACSGKDPVWDLRKLKNHWDAMREDYKIFRKLKFGQTGLGWNELTKQFEASDEWWKEKIKENHKFSKFRNKDMTYFVNYYDTLFGDVIATGERAKAANNYSAVNLEEGEDIPDFGEDDGNEGSGDSDDNNYETPQPPSRNLFPTNSFRSGSSSGQKRKKSGAEFVREGLDGLVAAMSCKSTAGSAEDRSLDEAIAVLDAMPEVDAGSDLYFFAQRYILNTGNRTLFLKARNNELRYGQLQYNYKHFKGSGGSSDRQ